MRGRARARARARVRVGLGLGLGLGVLKTGTLPKKAENLSESIVAEVTWLGVGVGLGIGLGLGSGLRLGLGVGFHRGRAHDELQVPPPRHHLQGMGGMGVG